MAIDFFNGLTKLILSSCEKPTGHKAITKNLLRISLQGTLGFGVSALASSLFSKYLAPEQFWKPVASHLFKSSLASSLTFSAATACILYKWVISTGSDNDKKIVTQQLNKRVSYFAKVSALVGWVGAAAALASKFAISNTHVSLLEKHLFELIGLAGAGSLLWLFHDSQNKQLTATKDITK